ncbi:LOW QUALITY PROTEIN: hypothetical protein V1477_014239 [Vespula maculifrons]|uniref:SnoaL-like domain-containing protein n=1 Tax=Vespula maculifrons TaxID=7453 RepID=A0ABD2BKG5_VESMC
MVQSCYVFRRVHIAVLYASFGYKKEESIMKLWSGDTGLPEMTTKSNVRPILIINGSVLLRISKSTQRSSRSTHSLEWGYSPTHIDNISRPTATGSVLLRISTSTHRSSPTTRSPQIQIAKWGYSAAREENKDGPSTDSYSYKFSCVLDFEEGTWKISRRLFLQVLTNS